MKVPNILKYNSYQSFLKDFFECNKGDNSPMSYRYLASKLSWSASNLNEIIHGKRTLNVQRALELARFLKMDSIQTERLIYLTMKESSTDEVRIYFETMISKQFNSDELLDKNTKLNAEESLLTEQNQNLVDDFPAILLYGFIRWCNGKTTYNDVVKLLYTCPQFKDYSFFKEKLNKLDKNGLIKINVLEEQKVEVEILKFHFCTQFDINTISHLANYTDNMSRVLRNPNLKGFFNSGIIKIRRERIKEARFRLIMLRNWLLEVEADSLHANPEDNILFQYDLSLGTAIDVNALGITDLKQYMAQE
ncbi:MAG: hypothetical protein K2Q18_07780 [Bdellovibrionales bacterium]|nr:hypothetical protein [Bdellovibrionales bacterium]